ncbi:hypothetical protein CCH79_00002876 [Gambusia affinis]|uniref:General transcription factor IIF subunit 2 n=1 Tax=Gambusia affinis TaxID=33528 RepID=A0A315W5Z6_GAMAF|nr:hypothetical protein CCH79_00002876 [Gambusia affinis]
MKNDDLRGAEEAPCGLNGWIIGRSTFTKAQRGKGFIFQVTVPLLACGGATPRTENTKTSKEDKMGSGRLLVSISSCVLGERRDEVSLEGTVVHRAECRPVVSDSYMKVKRLQVESVKPQRLVQQLDRAVATVFKPVANHDFNLEYEKKKKYEGKMVRADRQQVLDLLFSAFEKHQYYSFKDLVDITKQPVTYLKEIMREIGVCNRKGAHKSTWELKPEYRHYRPSEEEEQKSP